MNAPVRPLAEKAAEGVLGWWREAGVDFGFVDEAQVWLTDPGDEEEARHEREETRPAARPTPPPAVHQPPPPPQLDRAAFPADLAAFHDWWMSEPLLAEGAVSRRVPPRGATGAKLMVIVPEPEAEDRDALLSGREGRLLAAMLRAFELPAEQVYFASALPRHLPGADWRELARGQLGEVLLHHVDLAAPERVAILGNNVLPLIGHQPPQASADLRKINHDSREIPLLVARSLAAMIERPRWKKAVWDAWLGWD